MGYLLIIFLMLTFQSLYAVDVVAHRGDIRSHHENSLEAIRAAWRGNVDVIEIDIRITKDRELVLFHDESIEGQSIRASTLDEIRARNILQSFSTLVDALRSIPDTQKILIDIKDNDESVVPVLSEILGRRSNVFLQSEHITLLRKLRNIFSELEIFLVTKLKRKGLLMRQPNAKSLAYFVAKNRFNGISAKGRSFLDKDFIHEFRTRGIKFYVWTINDKKRMRYYRDLNVDGIITDEVGLLRQILTEVRKS